ncbi:32403_t:CDS:2, partial [Gigaspora margarita]
STTDSIYESGNMGNFFSAYDFGNPESLYNVFDSRNLKTFFNTFGPSNMEYFLNTFDPNNPKTFFEPINDERDNEAIQHTENSSSSSLKTYENQDNSESRYPIILNMKNGFAFTITHSEKNKKDGIPWRCTYKCTKGRPYVSRKEAHVVKNRDSGHHTIGCTFYINIYRHKKDNLIYISKINGQHNHELVDDINMIKNCVNGLSSILELEQSIEKLLDKESQFVRLNETMGHNARTCPSLAESYISDNSEKNNSENNSEENDPENNSKENNSEAEETNTKCKCGTCNMRSHNARTCSKK